MLSMVPDNKNTRQWQAGYQANRVPGNLSSRQGTRQSRCQAGYQAIRMPDRVLDNEGARPFSVLWLPGTLHGTLIA